MDKQTFNFIPSYHMADIVTYAREHHMKIREVFKKIHNETNFNTIIEYSIGVDGDGKYDSFCSILTWDDEIENYESKEVKKWRLHCEKSKLKKGAF